MRALEAIAVAALGGAVATAVVLSAVATMPRDDADAGVQAFRPPTPMDDPHGRAFAAAAGSRAGIDPLRPPGLPAGVTIDPATGLLSGADLAPGPDEPVVTWTRLSPADRATSAASLPDDLRGLDGQRAVMAGFLMPLYEVDQIRQFLLVGSHYACCFGKPPGLGGMVMVKLDRRAPALRPLLAPLRVVGTLRIREQRQGPRPDDDLLLLFEIEHARAAPLKYE